MNIDKVILGKEYSANISILNDGPLVFTFDNMASARGLDRPGWGNQFLRKKNVNVISFLESSPEAWYRRESFLDVLMSPIDLIGARQFEKKVSYGGSMGGYAAAAFADTLRCDEAILLNPISTLSREIAPWEKRYPMAKKMDWSKNFHDAAEGVGSLDRLFICVDGLFHPDLQHAKRISHKVRNTTIYRFPGVGHGLPNHMRKMGFLGKFIGGIVSGSPMTTTEFSRVVRGRREYVAYYKWMLSKENVRLTEPRIDVILKMLRTLAQNDVFGRSAHEIVDEIPNPHPLLASCYRRVSI